MMICMYIYTSSPINFVEKTKWYELKRKNQCSKYVLNFIANDIAIYISAKLWQFYISPQWVWRNVYFVKLFPTASIVTEEMRTALLSTLNLLSVEVTNQKSPLIASTELFSCFYVDWSAIEVKLLQKGSIHGSTMYILLENFQNLPCQSRKTRKWSIPLQ